MIMMCVLSAHKLSQTQGENNDFLQFMHDVITLLLVEAPRLINRKRLPRDNILCLTGRYFPGQIPYEGPGAKRKSVAKMCRVCYAQGKHRPMVGQFIAVMCVLTVQESLDCVMGIALESFTQFLISPNRS